MELKLAIIGKKAEVLPFKGLGIEPIFVSSIADAEEKILKIKKSETLEYGIVFLSEDFFQSLSDDIQKRISSDPLPAFVPIPGIEGATGYGDKRMKKFVEQAVGSDIFAE